VDGRDNRKEFAFGFWCPHGANEPPLPVSLLRAYVEMRDKMQFTEAVELVKEADREAIVLEARSGPGALLVAPGLVGRVMCSTFDQGRGSANGWINEKAIHKGKVDPVFNNFGGEERIWFAPEGGQFGLMFGRKESRFSNYHVQAGMSTIEYKVAGQDDRSVVMQVDMRLENNSGTRFDLQVERRVSLLESCPYALGAQEPLEFVAFQTENTVTNTGPMAWRRETGTLAIWCLGQFLEQPHLSIILPIRIDGDAHDSPPTVDEYFKDFCLQGTFPANRRVNFEEFVLLKADGKVRGKVGIKRERAKGRLGSYDCESGALIIVDHDFYPEIEYATGYWRRYEHPFDGDALSIYIDGPEWAGGPDGSSYELETMSPALFLNAREAFAYRNRTFHLRGGREVIGGICRKFLSAGLQQIEEFSRTAI
jgi:hypothetical protein